VTAKNAVAGGSFKARAKELVVVCCWVVWLSVSVQWEKDVHQKVAGFPAGLAGALYLNCRVHIPKQKRFMDDISYSILDEVTWRYTCCLRFNWAVSLALPPS
jgi:hypothetical protein